MMTQKDILKMVKHVARRSQNVPDRRLLHPKREWFIGIAGFLVVLLVGGIFSAQRFAHYNQIESELRAGEIDVISYKEGTMLEVLNFFDERTLRFQQLRNGIEPSPFTEVVEETDDTEETGAASEETNSETAEETPVEEEASITSEDELEVNEDTASEETSDDTEAETSGSGLDVE